MGQREDIARLEGSRWEILRALSVAGHIGATETMLFHTLVAMWLDMSRDYIRNQLDYLESRELIGIERHEVKDWRCKLTRHGWDVTSYVVDCKPGIARPQKYWGSDAGT